MRLRCCTLLICLVSVSAAPVLEKRIAYTCQEGILEAPFGAVDPQCDQSWTIGTKPIAYYKNGKGECSFPCKDVFSGKVILSECLNVTLTIGCTSKDGAYEETRLHFSETAGLLTSLTTTNTANNQFAQYGLWAFLILMVKVIIPFLL